MSIKEYQTQKGTRYMFTEHIGMDETTGKRIIITRRGFHSMREAKSKLAEIRYKFDNGELQERSYKTFQEAYEVWLPRYANTVKESTLNKAEQFFRIDILPVFATMQLDAIRPIDCQEFADHLATKYKNISKAYGFARRVYQYAYTVGITEKQNPFNRVIMPKPDSTPPKVAFMSREELAMLLEAMKGNKLWYTYFYVLGYTGARRGEGLAMRWEDIDFERATWHISSTIAVGLSNTQYITTPKTKSSDRTIDLDPKTLNVLKEWRASQKVASIKGLVFCSRRGEMLMVTKPYEYLKNVIKRTGLKNVSVHSFRHTHCSMLFESGWSIKEVQERLGHSDMKTTMNIYLHVMDSRREKSMKEFVSYLNAE